MKAMVLRGPNDLAAGEVPRPKLEQGQVLVRITHSGVCGTDLKIFNGSIPVSYPLIMGHEMVGEIVEGTGSDGAGPGTRVLIDPFISCGMCFHCRIGQSNLCANGVLDGRDANGGFAEYLAVPASNVFRLPDSISSRIAPLIQVMTTCLHAQRRATPVMGRSVVVLGLGVTGQLHVQLAKAHGAYPVIGVSRSAFKSELAQKLGADLTLRGREDAVDKVLEATGGLGADLVIETTGILTSLANAIGMARLGGTLSLFGITTAKEGALPFYQLYFKELSLINARAAKGEDFPSSIDLVHRGVVRLEPLITHVTPLAELGTAIDMLKSDVDGRLKIIVDHT
jgi:2-desacetyl-2-hydroxyethyl bacteriochlorophyllide A dehydrogenase